MTKTNLDKLKLLFSSAEWRQSTAEQYNLQHIHIEKENFHVQILDWNELSEPIIESIEVRRHQDFYQRKKFQD